MTRLIEVLLTPQLEAFVQKALSTGQTVDEVVNRAISLLQKQEDAKAHHETWLRAEIQKGEESSVLADEFDFGDFCTTPQKESTKNRGKARKLVAQPFKPLEQLALDTTAQRFYASRRRAPLS